MPDRYGPVRYRPSAANGASGEERETMSEFKAGLEGVVAVETEIAEPDRDGGQLRYRGIDIEDLVGHYPYENVWGLLVDDDLESKMPDPEPYEPATADRERARRSAGRDGAAGGRVEAREAQRDLGRAGARRPRSALRADDDDRRALGARRRRQDRTPSPTRSSHAVRPRPRSSSCGGAARPIRGT